MDLLGVVAATRPWHWWIAVFVFGGGILLSLATFVGYLIKVTSARYPRH